MWILDRPNSATRKAVWVLAVALWLATGSAQMSEAWGQCATCGNPAFSTGDNDLARTFNSDAAPGTRFRAGLVYSAWRYTDIYTGTRLLSDAEKRTQVFTSDWDLQIQVATLLAAVQLSTGTEFGLVLPFGIASATRLPEQGEGTSKDAFGMPLVTSHDTGLSDVELRVRQSLRGALPALPSWLPQMWLSIGAVAPTGTFLLQNPADAATDQYASLGRGTWWVLAELDLVGRIGERFGWLAGVSARLPLNDVEAGEHLFRWGNEVRGTAGLSSAILTDLLHSSLAVEWQWRASGEERIFADAPIEDFINGGGNWLTLQPSLQFQLLETLSLQGSVRIPLWRDVTGYQPVPGVGVVAGINWAWSMAATSAPKAAASGSGPEASGLANDPVRP